MKRANSQLGKIGKPQWPYRETIVRPAKLRGNICKQSGGRGQYGHVYLRIEPTKMPDAGYEFVNEIVGGIVLARITGVQKGLAGANEERRIAGYPLLAIKLLFSMVLFTMWIPAKWRLRLLARWR